MPRPIGPRQGRKWALLPPIIPQTETKSTPSVPLYQIGDFVTPVDGEGRAQSRPVPITAIHPHNEGTWYSIEGTTTGYPAARLEPALLISSIPLELKAPRQWVLWREETQHGKPTKVPYATAGRRAATDTPSTWGTLEGTLAVFREGSYDGIGYVFTADGGLSGIDLDDCVNADGEIEPWALEVVNKLASYTEYSPSRCGLHIIVKGKLPPGGRRNGHIEMYDSVRYFTVTGDRYPGSPAAIEERQAELEALHAKVFPKRKQPSQRPQCPDPVDIDDTELLQMMLSSASGGKIARLWAGDWSGYESQSEADLALCSHLVFWTGGDPARVDSLFRQSDLYRPKWDKKHCTDGRTYGQATIEKALSSATEFYTPGGNGNAQEEGAEPDQSDEEAAMEPITFCTADQIADFYGDVEWCWEGWIPKGHLTLIVGPQGDGKSFLAARLVGNLTGCIPQWPNDADVEQHIPKALIVETEEMRGVYVERMDKMGIDRSRYIFGPGDETYIPNLLYDAQRIEELAVQEMAGAIIIDSLSGGHALKENDAEMRMLLKQYVRIASKFRIPVILVHHPRKRNAIEPMGMELDRVRGSSTITQFCRSVIALYRLDDNRSAPVRVESIKCSFSAPPEPLGFTIDSQGLDFGEAPEIEKPATMVDAASDLLRLILRGGPKKASAIREEVESAGMSWSTARKAKKRLRIVSLKVEPGNGEKGYWEWSLPAHD